MPPDRLDDVWQAWRHTDRRFPPLWYGGGSKSLRQESGRWHQESRGVAEYLALSANGAWAERCRYAGIRDDVRRETEKRKLWNLQVIEHDIADLSSFDRYLMCGLKPEWAIGLHAEVWPLADDLRAAGYRGVLSPASAYDVPEALNLTLFGGASRMSTMARCPIRQPIRGRTRISTPSSSRISAHRRSTRCTTPATTGATTSPSIDGVPRLATFHSARQPIDDRQRRSKAPCLSIVPRRARWPSPGLTLRDWPTPYTCRLPDSYRGQRGQILRESFAGFCGLV